MVLAKWVAAVPWDRVRTAAASGLEFIRRRPKNAALILALVMAMLSWLMLAGGENSAAIGARSSGPPHNVVALGRIEPISELVRFAAPAPDRLDQLLVGRGDHVSRGQVLGYLASYQREVADREQLRARLAEARAQLEAEKAFGEAEVADAKLQLAQVEKLMPLRIAAQRAEVAGVEAELGNNRDILRSQGDLKDQGYATRRTVDNQRTMVHQNEEKRRAAEAQLAEISGRHELDRATAEIRISRAEAQLARAVAAIPIASLTQQLALADAKVALATLTAPIDGTVLNILLHPGEETSGHAILVMGDTSRMRAIAEVYETDAGAVRVGQRATVTSPALAQPVTGRVVEIGNMIFKNDVLDVDPAARTDARVVEARIDLDDASPVNRLSNLTVEVVIHTDPDPVAKVDKP